MKTLPALLLLFSTPVSADIMPDRISVLVGSHHVNSSEEYNESNPGLFLTWDQWTVGAYENSYSDISFAVTREWELTEHADIFVGAATYGDSIMPLAGLQLHAGPFFAQIIPSDGKYVDAIISFGLTYEIRN